MALIEVYVGERSLAFELTTAVCALGAIEMWTTMWNSHLYLVNFESEAEFVCTVFWTGSSWEVLG